MLLANGHPDAAHYAIGWLLDEAEIVRSRLKVVDANTAVWIQKAVASVLDKKGATRFNQAVKEVNDG